MGFDRQAKGRRTVERGWSPMDLVVFVPLRTTLLPPVATYDVGTWERPHTAALDGLKGRFCVLLGLAVVVLPFALSNVGAGDDVRDFATGLAAVVVLGAQIIYWRARGGYVSIDPEQRTITWHRPWHGGLGLRRWSFDDLTRVDPLRAPIGAFPRKVRLVLGASTLTLELPADAAVDDLAASLLSDGSRGVASRSRQSTT